MTRRQKYIFAKKRASQKVFEAVRAVLIVLAVAALGLFLYFNLFGTASKVKLKKSLQVEMGSSTMASGLIDSISDGGSVETDYSIDTGRLGRQKCKIVLDFDGSKRDYSFDVEVVDTTPPVISPEKDALTVFAGSRQDPLSTVQVSDNSGADIRPTADAAYDLNTAGTYSFDIEAVDASGNSASLPFTLTVIDPAQPEDYSVESDTGFTVVKRDGITSIDDIMIVNRSFSVPESVAPGGILYEAYYPYLEMAAASSRDGVSIYASDGYRSSYRQASLYESYSSDPAESDLVYARPGHSEHQTGYAIDINEGGDGFQDTPAGQWLAANCYKYGFIIRYPEGAEEYTGYGYKPWHLRYVGVDLAARLYNGGTWISMEEYFGIPSRYAA